MRTLDRYLIREFIKTYLILLVSMSVVFIVIDVIDHLPRLIRHEATLRQASYYYILRLPYLIILTSPITVLLTGLFLMNQLSKYNESTAIRAAGISIKRSMLPLFFLGILMSMIIAVMGEYLLPHSEAKREYLYRVLIRDEQPEDQMLKSRIHYIGKNKFLYYFGFFDGYNNSLRIIDISDIDAKTGKVREKITAGSAEWKFNNWILRDCEVRKFDGEKTTSWNKYASIVLPVMDVKPQDFIRITKKTLAMNFFELSEYIGRLKKLGDDYNKEMVDLHMKLAYPLTNFIVIFFFVPIATSNIRSKGRGLIFMLGILVCFLYLTLTRISQSLGYNQILSPPLAAWSPNIIFLLIGIIFVKKSEI